MQAKHIHLVGIGGIGLSAIARVLLARGYRVSGSDPAPSEVTDALSRAGATIYNRHREQNLSADTDLVVATSAVDDENPEIRAALARGIRVARRREVLGELTAGCQVVAVAGSHGKTTTTALVSLALAEGGLDPTAIVGGIVPEFGSNARIGQGHYFVIEADEYDNAFLGLEPYLGIITNVDYDHPDIFPNRAAYLDAFREFAHQVQPEGQLVVCGEDEGAIHAAEQSRANIARYGTGSGNLWRATDVRTNDQGGSTFAIHKESSRLGEVALRIPGMHNVLNSLGALAAAAFTGVSFDSARAAVERYEGVTRRFQVLGEFRGVVIVDDYAHHPAEIRATLTATRQRYPGKKLWAVFQPHTYTRTRALLNEFAQAFDLADIVVVTEVYAARERETLGVSGRDIVARMKHRDVRFIETLDGVVDYVERRIGPGSVLITLGAGDVNRAGRRLAELRNVSRSGT